jgi:Putative DNA-binding domain
MSTGGTNAEPTLAALQRRFQENLLQAGRDVSDFGDDAASLERLSIYSTAYRLRLQEALAANYPMLCVYLGKEAFDALALEYLGAHPSRHVSVRAFGLHLTEWLRTQRSEEPWLAEFARLEWALGCAFDAPDTAAISVDTLAQIEPARWPHLTFRFAPSVHRLSLHTNAASLYASAVKEQPAAAGVTLPEADEWLVYRTAGSAHYRSLAANEAVVFDVLYGDGAFADACERLFALTNEATVSMQAAAFLKRWLEDELIVTVVERE